MKRTATALLLASFILLVLMAGMTPTQAQTSGWMTFGREKYKLVNVAGSTMLNVHSVQPLAGSKPEWTYSYAERAAFKVPDGTWMDMLSNTSTLEKDRILWMAWSVGMPNVTDDDRRDKDPVRKAIERIAGMGNQLKQPTAGLLQYEPGRGFVGAIPHYALSYGGNLIYQIMGVGDAQRTRYHALGFFQLFALTNDIRDARLLEVTRVDTSVNFPCRGDLALWMIDNGSAGHPAVDTTILEEARERNKKAPALKPQEGIYACDCAKRGHAHDKGACTAACERCNLMVCRCQKCWTGHQAAHKSHDDFKARLERLEAGQARPPADQTVKRCRFNLKCRGGETGVYLHLYRDNGKGEPGEIVWRRQWETFPATFELAPGNYYYRAEYEGVISSTYGTLHVYEGMDADQVIPLNAE